MIIGWTITGQGGAYLGEYEGMEVCVCVVLKKTGENKIKVSYMHLQHINNIICYICLMIFIWND